MGVLPGTSADRPSYNKMGLNLLEGVKRMENYYPHMPHLPTCGPAMDKRMMRHMYQYMKMCHRMEREMMKQIMRDYCSPTESSNFSSSSSSSYRRGRYYYPMESSKCNDRHSPYRDYMESSRRDRRRYMESSSSSSS